MQSGKELVEEVKILLARVGSMISGYENILRQKIIYESFGITQKSFRILLIFLVWFFESKMSK